MGEIGKLWAAVAEAAADQKELAALVERAAENQGRLLTLVSSEGSLGKAFDILAGQLKIVESQVNDLILEVKSCQGRLYAVEQQCDTNMRRGFSALTKVFVEEMLAERREWIGRLQDSLREAEE